MKRLLREALNFLENADLDSSFNPPTAKWGHDLEASLRAAIDAPEQEPVGKLKPCREGWFTDIDNPPPETGETLPLYTKPPPVAELTDEELMEIWKAMPLTKSIDYLMLQFGKSVLAAQKAKL